MSEKWTLYAWAEDQPEPTQDEKYLFHRDYRSLASAHHAASQVHRRLPDAWIEIQQFESTSASWEEEGKRVAIVWCDSCGSPVERPPGDELGCPRCGDAWTDDLGPILASWDIEPADVTITRRDVGQSRITEGWARLQGTINDGSGSRLLFVRDERLARPLIEAVMRQGSASTVVPQDDDSIIDIYVPGLVPIGQEN